MQLDAPAWRAAVRPQVASWRTRGGGASRPSSPWFAVDRCIAAPCQALSRAATRPRGEPAWHRRARRGRAEARTIVRIEAARARLAAHHSSQHGGMLRRNGGFGGPNAGPRAQYGSGAAGGGLQAARQFFLSLFDGANADWGRVEGRGKGGGKGIRRGGNASRPREGEWQCSCGFATNRPHRTACFCCGRDRAVAELQGACGGKGGGAGAASRQTKEQPREGGRGPFGEDHRGGGGPVGANGSRPLLGSRGGIARGGQEDTAKGTGKGHKGSTPTEGGKAPGGVSNQKAGCSGGGKAAGWGEAAPQGGTGAGKGPTMGGRAWGKPTPRIDEEGFETVQPRRVRLQRDEDITMDLDATNCDRPAEPPVKRLWSDEMSDDEGDGDDDQEEGAGEWGHQDWGEEGGQETDPKVLRATFEAHAKVVRDMERWGRAYEGSPALETLRAARDAAEQAWRCAKTPAPLPVRMGRAESKLERSETALSRARLALDEFDERTHKQREVLVRKIEEADRWYRWRQRQLDLLHKEAGEKVAAKCQGMGAAAGASEVRSRIRGSFLPAVQEIIEHVEGNPEIVARLAMLADGLDEAEKYLGADQAEGGAEKFDIGGDESAGEDAAATGTTGEQGGRNQSGPGARASEGKGAGKASEWKPEGAGRWTRKAATGEAQPQGSSGHVQTGGRPTTGGPGDMAASAASGNLARAGEAPAKGIEHHVPAMGGAATGAMDTGTSGGTSSSGGNGGGLGHPRATTVDDDDEPECREQEAKHRRRRTAEEARQESDARRAMDLLREQQAAMEVQVQSHQAGAGGFGSEMALSMAAQKFVHEVRRAEARAEKKGIKPLHEGKALLEVSPMELQQWVQANLGDDSENEY